VQRGRYFEEFAPGDKIVTPARTIYQADISQFAGLSGDYNPIHTDDEYCRETPFGAPLAHGLLVLSVLSGLVERTGIHEGTIIAMRRIDEVVFKAPVFAGDTVSAELEVVDTQAHGEAGKVQFLCAAHNQRKELVLQLKYAALFRCRPAP